MSKKNKNLNALLASKDQLQSIVSESDPQDKLAEPTSESETIRSLETTLSEGVSIESQKPTLSQDASNVEGMAEGGSDTVPSTAIPINDTRTNTLGGALYSQMVTLSKDINDFELDVSQEPLKVVVKEGVVTAIKELQAKANEEEKERQEKLRSEGKPATPIEVFHKVVEIHTEQTKTYSKNVEVANDRYSFLIRLMEEALHRIIHKPIEPPKKPASWQELKRAFITYPWYYIRLVYFSWHVRHFMKIIAWSSWCVCIGLFFFVIHQNKELEKTKEQYKMVKYYYLTNEEVHKTFILVEGLYADPEANANEINAMVQTINKKNQQKTK